MTQLFAFIALLAAGWYVLITRPSRRHASEHDSVVGQIRTGVGVMTVGGIFGRVTDIHGDSVTIEVSPGVSAQVVTSGIARIVDESQMPRQPQTQPVAQPQAHALHHGQPQVAAHGHPQQVPVHPSAPAAVHAAMQQPQPQVVMAHGAPQPQAPQYQPAAPQPTSYGFQVQSPFASQHAPQHEYAPMGSFGQQYAPQLHTSQMAAPQAFAPQGPNPYAPRGYALGSYESQPASPFGYTPAFQEAPQYIPGLMPAPGSAVPTHYGTPVTHDAHMQPVQQLPPQGDSRRSSAPSGMGSAQQIDAATRELLNRARSERLELADEYRQLTSSLVLLDEPAPAESAQHAVQAMHYEVAHNVQLHPDAPPAMVQVWNSAPAAAGAPAALHNGVPRPGGGRYNGKSAEAIPQLFAKSAPVPGTVAFPAPASLPPADHGTQMPVDPAALSRVANPFDTAAAEAAAKTPVFESAFQRPNPFGTRRGDSADSEQAAV